MAGFETAVDLDGLMSLLSEHLYSTPDVAIRELVQNAHDSITRRAILDQSAPPGRIDVVTEPAKQRIIIRDNGAGLSEPEFHTFLATVGVGASRGLRDLFESEDIIGYFGLGFLSAFTISDEVSVTSTSMATPTEAHRYSSSDAFTYTIDPATVGPIGTEVVLNLKPSHVEFADPSVANRLLERYCQLLPIDIYLNGSGPINLSPPWRNVGQLGTGPATPGGSDPGDLEFAGQFENRFEPLAAIRIGSPDGLYCGVLWIHGGSTYGNADNRWVSAYVRGMLLAENDIDLLPRWAGFVSGVVESTSLSPTASRETLRKDANYVEVQAAIAEDLIVGLQRIATSEPALWRRILRRHSESLIGAALGDSRLFDQVCEQVEIPSSAGDLAAHRLVVENHIYVTTGVKRGFEELLFVARGLPIASGDRYGVLEFLRRYVQDRGLRLIEIGSDSASAAIFTPVRLDDEATSWLQAELGSETEKVVLSNFEPPNIALVVIPDRQAELHQRLQNDEIDRSAGSAMAALARLHTAEAVDRPMAWVHLNATCPTIQHLLAVRTHNPVGAMRAVTFLRAFKAAVLATDGEQGNQGGLDEAMGDALAMIDGLLLDGTEGAERGQGN